MSQKITDPEQSLNLMEYRRTSQYLIPSVKPYCEPGSYDIYPSFDIGPGKISGDIMELADEIASGELVLIDGYAGVFFEEIRQEIDSCLVKKNMARPHWLSTSRYLKSEEEINRLAEPFLGGDDPLFGTRADIGLADFFTGQCGEIFKRDYGKGPLIIYGIGASLFSENGFLIWLDLPKNEIQFRSRAGSVTSIGAALPSDPKSMYKRFYFVDWVVLNRHKRSIIGRIDIIADTQRRNETLWMRGDDFRKSLDEMSRNPVRVRPWFEPGSWGGSWIKRNISGLNPDVPNYAWSFELISPENGIILESSGRLLEVSFDFLMYRAGKEILGDCYDRFGCEFPIRFDFLDTFEGGNLSIQCHPRPDYMKKNFGEDFTQEETYYILDAGEDAGVYLGFQEGIERDLFEKELEESQRENNPVDIDRYVQFHPSGKHDLFLIPYGTVHGSGRNNLVLEISSTPYIFTFKMYDWLRPDLDGKPRPLNIRRAMDNLYFDRSGRRVAEEFIPRPVLIKEEEGHRQYHLPTHQTHLYDIHRYHISKSAEIKTEGKCLVLNLTEGDSIIARAAGGREQRFNYAETFIIPAAAESVTIFNDSGKDAIVVSAFVK